MSVVTEPTRTRTLRIVVADDSEPIRALMVARLDADDRFEVVGQAADGDAAVDVAVATDADALLLDLSMPGADGLHALRRLRAEGPQIATVVMTGFRAGEFAGEALDVGAAAYVEKGVDLDRVADVLASAATGAVVAGEIVSPETVGRVAPVPQAARSAAPGLGAMAPATEAVDTPGNRWIAWIAYVLLLAATVSGLAWSQATNRDRITEDARADATRSAAVASAHITEAWAQLGTAGPALLGPAPTAEDAQGVAAALGADGGMVLDEDGVVLASARNPAMVGTRPGDTYDHIARLVAGEPIASDVVVSPSGMRITSVGVPLPDGRAITVAFDVDGRIGTDLLVGVPDDVARAWVVDSAGDVIASRTQDLLPEEQLLPPPTVARALQGEQDVAGWLSTASPVDGTGWSLVTTTPTSRVFADVAGAVTALPWVLVALVATAGAVAISAYDRSRSAVAELRTTNRELATSNEDLEQFAYVASHDLQEPLRKVASYCQLLERRYGDELDDTAHTYIHYAVDGATRMQALLSDLLRFSRAARGDRIETQVVDLALPIARAVDALSLRIEECSAIVVLPEDPPAVLADATQVQQLVQNLVANALKFTRPGRAPTVSVRATTDGTTVKLSIADDGIGIAAEHQERIFGLFQRLHSRDEYEGTGVGLAICRRMVERAGGRLWVTSTPGAGATFHATFPAVTRS